jgi:hypothetical protein
LHIYYTYPRSEQDRRIRTASNEFHILTALFCRPSHSACAFFPRRLQ